jgi:hypothetical protein
MPVRAYRFAAEAARAPGWRLFANEVSIDVLLSDSHPFATFESEGAVEVSVTTGEAIPDGCTVEPRRHGIVPSIDGDTIAFHVPGPGDYVLNVPGRLSLYIWVNPVEVVPDLPNTRRFAEGTITDVGQLRLSPGENLYLEGGAILRGAIRATSTDGLRIGGYGILDGAGASLTDVWRRLMVIEGGRDVVVENIIMIRPRGWMLTLGDCENVIVRNIKQIGTVLSSDGIDIVGSRHVHVHDCFLRNGDDCVVIKSLDLRREDDILLDHTRPVHDVLVERCSLLSYLGGNGIEIGFELCCDCVRDITFSDCDILAVNQYGAAMSIHNSDHATVENITYRNIRVEHCYDKLFDIRVVRSRWSRDSERGHIRNIRFENIDVRVSVFNEGYTSSLIGGFDSDHRVSDVTFENVRMNGELATNGDDIWLFTKHADAILFQ